MTEPELITVEKETDVPSTSRKKRSTVYDHFTVILDDKDHLKCNVCSKKIKIPESNSTGNLNKHLKTHKIFTNSSLSAQDPKKDEIQPTIKSLFTPGKFSQLKFEQLLVDWIVMTDQPFTVVEDKPFLELCKYLHPTAKIPSGDTIHNRIFDLHEKEKNILKEKLQSSPGKISFVLDCWTSRNMFGFQGIIAQWIDENWKLQSLVVDLDYIRDSHTGTNLAKSFYSVLVEFGLTDKLLGVTTDNATNMDTMFDELGSLLEEVGVQFNASDQRVRCLAHIINLACKAAISELKNKPTSAELNCDVEVDDSDEEELKKLTPSSMSTLEKLKMGIGKIRKSEQRRITFEDACKIAKIEHKELVNDMDIRWNTTYELLIRSLELKVPFESTLRSESTLSKFQLTGDEWSQVKEIINFLKPFDDMTKVVSTNVPMMALSAMVYVQLYNHLESCNIENGHSNLIVSAAKSACAKLNKYYPSSDGLAYVVGTVLDPRCKLEWYKQVGFSSQTVKNYRKSLSDCWVKMYKPRHTSLGDSDSLDLQNNSTDLFAIQMKKARIERRDELQVYLSDPVVASESLEDGILSWWKANSEKFPNLCRMARDYLPISGTGVPIERFFSSGPDLLAPKRLSLSPISIKKCLTLKAWLKCKNVDKFQMKIRSALADKIMGN